MFSCNEEAVKVLHYAGYTVPDYDAASASADASEVGVGMAIKLQV